MLKVANEQCFYSSIIKSEFFRDKFFSSTNATWQKLVVNIYVIKYHPVLAKKHSETYSLRILVNSYSVRIKQFCGIKFHTGNLNLANLCKSNSSMRLN